MNRAEIGAAVGCVVGILFAIGIILAVHANVGEGSLIGAGCGFTCTGVGVLLSR